MAENEVVVSLTFSRRPDGGLRIHSDTLPGLVLSSRDVPGALADLGPAIELLLWFEGRWPLTSEPLRPPPSPPTAPGAHKPP